MLAKMLSRYWWMTLLRGVLWILFGVVVFVRPDISLVTLTLTFGAFAFVDGVLNVWNAISGREDSDNWWLLLLAGLAGIVIGILTFKDPAATALALQFYIALWAVAVGLLQLVAAVWLRKEIEGEFWLALSGIASIAFGVLVVARPAAGALAILWLIAGYAIVFGVMLIVFAFTVRNFANRITGPVKQKTA